MINTYRNDAYPGDTDLFTGTITANLQTVAFNCNDVSNVTMHMVATSLVSHNCTFEASIDSTNGTDGTWFAIGCLRTNSNSVDLTTTALSATPAYAWETSVNGYAWIRVRATAHTSGTATWKFHGGTFATEPIPAAQVSATQPISGTVTANIGGTWVTGINTSAATGGVATWSKLPSAANTTNATVVKSSAGRVYQILAHNTSAAVKYLKLYNKATAPTVGTDVPVVTIAVPIGNSINILLGNGSGAYFATGIGYALTGAAADNDTTALAAGDIVGLNIGYA